MSTQEPALTEIIVGEERCTLVYSDGYKFDVSRETYNRALGTLITGSVVDGREAIKKDFGID